MRFKPVVLIILDGFGVNTLPGESPMQIAKKPTLDDFSANYPLTTLQASGLAVGLPWGEEGNSEVGHLTIGAGRVLYHHLPRIIVSIQDGTFFENPVFLEALAHIRESHGTLHIMGLFSTGSVHAYVDHLYALLNFAEREHVEKVALHLFGDGRDSPARELKTFLPLLEERLRAQYKNTFISTLMGRHFSMDREERWELTKEAYDCLIGIKGEKFDNSRKYIDASYTAGITDEFLKPAWLVGSAGIPRAPIKDGDAVIFFNFREDSVRQITRAFLEEKFNKFERVFMPNIYFVTMTEYDSGLPAHVAYPPLDVEWPLSRVISHAGIKQLHIAETEKYAHVTYFFNGGKERPFPDEERVLIPSARVPFDKKPEMSAVEITDSVLANFQNYDFIMINFANADMVGHTGNFDATVKAIEILDSCLLRLKEKILPAGGILVITGDHGNAEEKRYRITGEPRTKHSANPVPIYLIGNEFKRTKPRSAKEIEEKLLQVEGGLSDVAPTILDLMGIAAPSEMTGINLLPRLLV